MSLRDILAKVADWMRDPEQDPGPPETGAAPGAHGGGEPVSAQCFYERPVMVGDTGFASKVETARERDGQVQYSVENALPLTTFGEQVKKEEVSRCTAAGCRNWDKTVIMVRCAMPGCGRLLCKACQYPLVEPQGELKYCPTCHKDAAKAVNTWVVVDQARQQRQG